MLPLGLEVPTPALRPPAELARHPPADPFEGRGVVLVELKIPPGGSGTHHRHPGAVLGYVMEGQLRFAINNEPEQVLPMGRTFFEPAGALHTTTGSARKDGPTRVWSSCWCRRGLR